MGRKDAVQFSLEWVAEARRLGALVTIEPGAETRGNGTSADYEGGNVHHTGTGSSLTKRFPTRNMLITGRPDLRGPLCNVAAPVGEGDRPHLHLIAMHPANHAGASGGKSMGPMPVTASFNKRSFGLEIDYGGNVAMSPGQYRAALIFTRALVNVLKRSTEYVRAHAETSVTGKWDPGYAPGKTIDMAAFRRDAANLTTSAPAPEEDMPLTDDDVARIASRVLDIDLGGGSLADFVRANVELRRANGTPQPIHEAVLNVDLGGGSLADHVRRIGDGQDDTVVVVSDQNPS